MRAIKFIYLFLSLFIASSAAVAAPTLADYVVRLQEAGPNRIIQHCAEKSPETREALAEEQRSLRKKLAEASAPLLARNPAQVPPGMHADLDRFVVEIGQKQLDAIKELDPQAYCPWLVTSLKTTTTEKLRGTIEQAYARYAELANRNGAKNGK